MRPARASRTNAPPESQTRPTLTKVQPAPDPPEEMSSRIDPKIAIRAAREADEYAEIRTRIDALTEEKKELEAKLIADMRASEKRRFTTERGLVSFLPATEPGGEVVDQEAAIALLESKGIPLPPTLEEWLGRHGLAAPKKQKKELPDRIEFRKS